MREKGICTAFVESLSHDGRGIARIQGKTTFIQGALANETVTFQYTRKKRAFDEGTVVSIETQSPLRVTPRCSHYTRCGGCSMQHMAFEAQCHEKEALFLDILKRVGHCQPETVLPALQSDVWHYRNKARFSVRYDEKRREIAIGFREKNNPSAIVDMVECPIVNKRFEAELAPLHTLLQSLDAPQSIPQIELAAGDDDIALVLRTLSPLSAKDKDSLCRWARESLFRIFVQPAGPDSTYLLYPEDGKQSLHYQLDDLRFDFFPTDFTQVHAGINRLMVVRARELLAIDPEDVVLDLYCGLGNFALPLARHAAKVIGIEGNAAMVARALQNAKANAIENASFFCANLDDPNALSPFSFCSKVLLDPPRTGALAIVQNIHLLNPKRLVYVSCNPATFARDANILVNLNGFRMISASVMDMFPHTAHVESIALFEKG